MSHQLSYFHPSVQRAINNMEIHISDYLLTDRTISYRTWFVTCFEKKYNCVIKNGVVLFNDAKNFTLFLLKNS